MSLNFYIFTNKKELKPFFGPKLKLIDEPYIGYQIHIAKTSKGWQPRFEAHDCIRSIADLKLLYDKGDVRIFDENHVEYIWNEFVERVVDYGDEHNWRTYQNNDQGEVGDRSDFTSVDGYWFTTAEFF